MADSHREEIAKLETLYANNPEGRVFTHLAEAYRKAGELERAREILEDGLRRHSDYSSAHVVLGRVLADQGQPEGASAAFRRVLELDRHNLVALRSLGEIATDTGNTDEALHYYRELLSLDPSDERLRTTVRGLEERREAEAAAPPAALAVEESLPAAEPTAEPPAFVAEQAAEPEPVPDEAPFAPQAVAEEVPQETTAEPVSGWTAQGVWVDEAPTGEGAHASENWEEDVGIELEAMPGDLESLTEEARADEAVAEAADDEWAVSSEWLGQPAPTDALATGLDLGIAGEEAGRVELPVSDLDLTEPAGDELTPFDLPGGTLELAGSEIEEPTPFDLTEEPAGMLPDAVFGPLSGTEGLDIDVGPVTPEFGGIESDVAPPVDEPEPSYDAAAFDGILAEPPETEQEPERAHGELVTETMAELYFAQGFYGRAADVYRSLMGDRPGDERLAERLAEAESMMGWPAAGGPAEEPPAGAEEPGEAWLEGVESAWTGGGGVAGGETTPYAWAEPSADEAPAGPRVGEFFSALLAWRPGAVEFTADEGTTGFAADLEASPQAVDPVAYDAAETEAPAYPRADAVEERGSGEMEAAAPEPWDAPAPVRAPELPEAASMAGADDEDADDDEDLEMFRSWLQSLRK